MKGRMVVVVTLVLLVVNVGTPANAVTDSTPELQTQSEYATAASHPSAAPVDSVTSDGENWSSNGTEYYIHLEPVGVVNGSILGDKFDGRYTYGPDRLYVPSGDWDGERLNYYLYTGDLEETTVHAITYENSSIDWNITVKGAYWGGVVSGDVFLAKTSNQVYAFNRSTGEQLWKREMGELPDIHDGDTFKKRVRLDVIDDLLLTGFTYDDEDFPTRSYLMNKTTGDIVASSTEWIRLDEVDGDQALIRDDNGTHIYDTNTLTVEQSFGVVSAVHPRIANLNGDDRILYRTQHEFVLLDPDGTVSRTYIGDPDLIPSGYKLTDDQLVVFMYRSNNGARGSFESGSGEGTAIRSDEAVVRRYPLDGSSPSTIETFDLTDESQKQAAYDRSDEFERAPINSGASARGPFSNLETRPDGVYLTGHQRELRLFQLDRNGNRFDTVQMMNGHKVVYQPRADYKERLQVFKPNGDRVVAQYFSRHSDLIKVPGNPLLVESEIGEEQSRIYELHIRKNRPPVVGGVTVSTVAGTTNITVDVHDPDPVPVESIEMTVTGQDGDNVTLEPDTIHENASGVTAVSVQRAFEGSGPFTLTVSVEDAAGVVTTKSFTIERGATPTPTPAVEATETTRRTSPPNTTGQSPGFGIGATIVMLILALLAGREFAEKR
ncbi:MAG: hypothetical protein V5A23_03405 [Halobacteriales archaeon]